MVERHRYSANARERAQSAGRHPGALPHLYRGGGRRRTLSDIYTSDHLEHRQGGRFRWLLSTCLAAAVGALAIIVVIFGSADPQESGEGLIPALKRMGEAPDAQPIEAALRKDDGLKWAVPKSDKLQLTTGTVTARYLIHDALKQRRAGRDYIYAKPYVRVVMRLATVPANYADVIPPFNPYKLYANNQPLGSDAEERQRSSSSEVDTKVVELLGGILPGEDGQELDAQEVDEIVARARDAEAAVAALRSDSAAGTPAPLAAAESLAAPDADGQNAPNTTSIARQVADDEDDDSTDLEGLKRFQKTAVEGDTLAKVLAAAGAENWIIKSILEAAKPVFPEGSLKTGFEVQVGLLPSVTQQNKLEPARLSVFDEGHAHKLTVYRDASGEFIASADAVSEDAILRRALSDSDTPQPASVYASLYAAGLMQQVQPETITQILRIHATETDFRRRIRPGDSLELFFDVKDESGLDGPPGELLFTAITTGGETRRFFRFRASDGTIDFYDENGNNSRKFLTRKPVRGDDVRLVSGYGMRLHPLLNVRRMHTGVDWASPTGTPILAAGNGTVEEVGHKGGYGNYVRIRHANGYQTAYGHLSRYAPGLGDGVRIKQSQIIGYVGCTGLCQGPHVHFEILINNQFVDPLSIQVPNERQLAGADLQEFQKERTRIDELKMRAAVATMTK